MSVNEKKTDTALLIIDKDGNLTSVTDKTKLNGSLVLPKQVTKIKEQVFSGCTGLTSVNFSACTNLTEIGLGAFYGCTGITGILDFSGCTSLTEIGEIAFDGCTGLTEVHLPASLTYMDGTAFKNCSNLYTLTVDPANPVYCSKDNVLYTKDMKTLVCTAGGMKEAVISDTVTEIAAMAFSGCAGLKRVDLSKCTSLTQIGEMAFENCTELTEVRLPANLSQIGWRAFISCSNLHTLTVDPANEVFCTKDNVLYTKDMTILVYAAEGITEVCIPDTVTEIFQYAFASGSRLHTLTVDPANTAFCSKDNVIYTKDMKTLVCATAGAAARTVLPDTLIEIGRSAFEGYKDLTSVDFSACTSLQIIGSDAFSRCTGLISLDLSACTSLTVIEGQIFLTSGPFEGCTDLREVRFPASLTEIGPGTFGGCTKLAEIHFPARLTQIGSGAFSGCTGLRKLDLSACTNLTEIEGTNFLSTGPFVGCTGIEEVLLPESLTNIGDGAFADFSPDAKFTVPTEAVKQLLKDYGIMEEYIRVKAVGH